MFEFPWMASCLPGQLRAMIVVNRPEGPHHALVHAFALLALFGRCLVAGAIVSTAAWMLITALMDQFV